MEVHRVRQGASNSDTLGDEMHQDCPGGLVIPGGECWALAWRGHSCQGFDVRVDVVAGFRNFVIS